MVYEEAMDAELAIWKGNYDEAIELIHANRRKDWDKMQSILSKAHRLKGELNESKMIIEKMCDDGDYCSIKAQYEAGLVYYELGEYDKAKEYLNGYLNHYQDADPEFIDLIKAQKTLAEWDRAGN